MTKNTMTIELTCNDRTLLMGAGADMDITKVTGLEASDLEVSLSDYALLDGAGVDGKRIKPRPIHIEASFKNNLNNPENRAEIIKFFNPKYTGKALITNMGTSRNIEYELEDWAFEQQANLDDNLGIVVDLICPDPYMLNIDNFGKNMADITPLFAFPWRITTARLDNKLTYPEEARGMLLGSMPTGYRTLRKDVTLTNDGDVPTGLQIECKATRGTVTNPKITNTDTGEFMRVHVVMQQGDVLIIDTNERHQVITLNGVNYYHHIDRQSSPFLLSVGENHLEYDADVNYVNLDVTLYYRPKYLGV